MTIADDETTSTQARRLHAAGEHPYRRVALSRRLPGCKFQPRAPQALRADPGAGEVRRLLHGRPYGRAPHADRCVEAQPHGHVVRAVHAALRPVPGHGANRPRRHGVDDFRRALSHCAALNFGMEEHMEHGERYARAREFYDVVTGLWDSWADDAFIRDADNGIYFDPDKLHVLEHKGKYLSVRGPLNIARPIQGWPVIVQAGASEAGRQIAAETAEVIFEGGSSLTDAKHFYADVKGRAE